MAKDELRIITPEERILLDPRGRERISRGGGEENSLMLGRVAVFGEPASSIDRKAYSTEERDELLRAAVAEDMKHLHLPAAQLAILRDGEQ